MDCTRLVVRKMATQLNHKAVLIIIRAPARTMVEVGVSGDITIVNNQRKNNVALGLRTFTANPDRSACLAESDVFLSATIVC